MSPNGGEQGVTTEVDSMTYGHFKDAYGPPEYFVGQPYSLVLTHYRFEVVVLRLASSFLASAQRLLPAASR